MMLFEKNTICALFHRQALRYGDSRIFLSSTFDEKGRQSGSYHHLTWKDVREQVLDFGRGLAALGLQPGNPVALVSENRPWWIVADQAILGCGGICGAINPDQSNAEILLMVRDLGSSIAIVSTEEKASMLCAARAAGSPGQVLIVMEPLEGGRQEGILSFIEVMELGRRSLNKRDMEDRIDSVEPGDRASIVYTSGSTGHPRGAILTHENWMTNIRQGSHALVTRRMVEQDVLLTHLVHLPLAQAYGRAADYHTGGLSMGANLVFSGTYRNIQETLREIRPNVIVSVPRFFEELYDRVVSVVTEWPSWKQALFRWALRAGVSQVKATAEGSRMPARESFKLGLANSILFHPTRKEAGLDRLVYALSGGARMSEEASNLIRALGVQLNEGYGLTETSSLVCLNEPDLVDFEEAAMSATESRMIDWLMDVMVRDQSRGKSPFGGAIRPLKLSIAYRKIGYRLRVKPGSVGRPVIDTEVKIDEDGEILVRGPQMFKGYWNLPRETEAVFTEEGWFRTGDIGKLDREGFLFIVDRKKNIIVTSGGHNIAPAPIEESLCDQAYISQAFVVGEGRKYCTALIVPDFKKLASFARSLELRADSKDELLALEQVQALIREQVDEVNRRLPRHEKVRYCSVLTDPFSVRTGELTATRKMKRRAIEEKYRAEIDAMYE